MSADNPPIPVTFFTTFAATSKIEERISLAALAERIRTTSGPDKVSLPWLKMAQFGNAKTAKGSLRHDANLLAISGIEADYDAGQMDVDAALALLEQQDVASIVYTSPSHTEEAPRWRVLCPLSEAMPPDRRSPLLGRLNGLFRGVFARESWTLSQGYYFGSIRNNPSHRVELIDGTPIDLHDDLDPIWMGPPTGGSASAGAGSDAGPDAREDAELIRCIVTGEGLHVEMCALAARYIGRGLSVETTAGLLRGMLLSHPDAARDERWLDRYYSIDMLVGSAAAKFAGSAEHRRALARLACSLIRERRPCAEVQAAVRAEAGSLGIDGALSERIVAWAARQELARRETAHV